MKKSYKELEEEISQLKAQNWVLKDNSLRTYDGLAQKADKFDKLKDTCQNTVGSWLSAALEDPAVCQEMKDDINQFFDVLGE